MSTLNLVVSYSSIQNFHRLFYAPPGCFTLPMVVSHFIWLFSHFTLQTSKLHQVVSDALFQTATRLVHTLWSVDRIGSHSTLQPSTWLFHTTHFKLPSGCFTFHTWTLHLVVSHSTTPPGCFTLHTKLLSWRFHFGQTNTAERFDVHLTRRRHEKQITTVRRVQWKHE